MDLKHGKDVYIRPISLSDINQTYLGWLLDPEVNRFLETRHTVQTLETITKFVSDKINSNDEYLMAICHMSSGRHIGNIKVGPINVFHQTADVSLFIGEKQMWGKGYAAQAIYLASRFAFEEKDVFKLKAGCYSTNIGSKKAFLKCGYRIEGELRDTVKLSDVRVNGYIFGLIKGELKIPWHEQ